MDARPFNSNALLRISEPGEAVTVVIPPLAQLILPNKGEVVPILDEEDEGTAFTNPKAQEFFGGDFFTLQLTRGGEKSARGENKAVLNHLDRILNSRTTW